MRFTGESKLPSQMQPLLERRFQLLLLALLSLFVFTPFFESTVIIDLAMTFMLLFAISAVSDNRRLLIASAFLATLAIGAIWSTYWISAKALFVTAYALDLAFFTIVSVAILSHVFRAGRVTAETIAGAICVYLLIGVMWANVFSILETVQPGSFSSGGVQPHASVGETSLRAQFGHFAYYSFVTLSTLGYGEITPLTRPARSLAALEAIVGQLYLAVLIARLVAQYVAPKGDAERDKS